MYIGGGGGQPIKKIDLKDNWGREGVVRSPQALYMALMPNISVLDFVQYELRGRNAFVLEKITTISDELKCVNI